MLRSADGSRRCRQLAYQPGTAPLVITRTLDGHAQITFPRRLAADDLSVTVQVSTDLVTWSSATTRTAHINNTNGTATETWTANTASPVQFLRLRVVK